MELDIELCRDILKEIVKEGGAYGLNRFPHIEGKDDDFVFYQIRKMQEAGYVKYKRYMSETPYDIFKIEIIFQGHQFLNQMLDDTIWAKIKKTAKKESIPLTFEGIKVLISLFFS